MEQWNPNQQFLQFISATSTKIDTLRFVVHGEQRTLRDLIQEMEVGTTWGKSVYVPLYKAYTCQGPLQQQYQSWQEQQSL